MVLSIPEIIIIVLGAILFCGFALINSLIGIIYVFAIVLVSIAILKWIKKKK
jgi:hypothetical protein